MQDETSDDEQARTALVKKVTRVFDGFLKIDEAIVSHPRFDGGRQTVTRQSMERGDAVAVLLVDRTRRKIWLTEQFRYSTLEKGPGWIEEIPAGMPNTGESFEDAALREVQEETGFTGLDLEHISTFYVSPGGTTERIALYAAFVDGKIQDAVMAAETQDKEEDILLVEVDVDDFIQASVLGRIDDAKTLIAGLWLGANRERLNI